MLEVDSDVESDVARSPENIWKIYFFIPNIIGTHTSHLMWR